MDASNSGGFLWTEEKSSIILEIMTHLVLKKKFDPLADGMIVRITGVSDPRGGGGE